MEGIRILLERSFNYDKARTYSASIQVPTLFISLLYIASVFATKAYMTTRKPFDLRRTLQAWNLLLAVYSLISFVIATVEIVGHASGHGLASTYLNIPGFFEKNTCGRWAYLFVLSKFLELGDTVFLVLRKKPLLLMHWLHHVTTLNLVLAGYVHDTHLYSWLLWMNTFIHSLMYTYYFLASCGLRLPAGIAKKVTTLQLIQFSIGLSILGHILVLKLTAPDAQTHCGWPMWFGTLAMELLYFSLFANFYYVSYIKDGGKKFIRDKTEKQQQTKSQ